MTHRILALDTTTEACSVAAGDARLRARRWERLPRGHSERLLPMIGEVLAEAGWTRSMIDAVAFCHGPGSFTGVRIAAGAAQGLALGLDRPVIPVSTLATLAEATLATGGGDAVLAAIDARMGEVYWGGFVRGAGGDDPPVVVADECVSAPGEVVLPPGQRRWAGVGTGFAAHPADLAERLGPALVAVRSDRLPDARYLWALARRLADAGGGVEPEAALPVYLRNRVAVRRSP